MKTQIVKGFAPIIGNNLSDKCLIYNQHLEVGMDVIRSYSTLAEKIDAEIWFKDTAKRLLNEAKNEVQS